MELGLVKKGMDFKARRRKWLLIFAALGVSSYGAYMVYHMPSVARKQKRLMKIFETLISLAEWVFNSAETTGTISRYLKEFLHFDVDEIPKSLKQISKIARSNELSESLSRLTESLIGILRGYNSEVSNRVELETGSSNSSFFYRVMKRVFSTAGTGFVSVEVARFASNLVMGFYSGVQSQRGSNLSNVPRFVGVDLRERDLIIVLSRFIIFFNQITLNGRHV